MVDMFFFQKRRLLSCVVIVVFGVIFGCATEDNDSSSPTAENSTGTFLIGAECPGSCGDGICENFRCLAQSCPCQETVLSCAEDCTDVEEDAATSDAPVVETPVLPVDNDSQGCVNTCGDEVCADGEVCFSDGCPCVESELSCPDDCLEQLPATPSPMCIDECGDGVCAEVVCFAEGCPCAETPDSCPADCLENDPVNYSGCVDRCGDGDCAEIVCFAEGCPCSESSASCPADCGSR